jgi:hypothetical protein
MYEMLQSTETNTTIVQNFEVLSENFNVDRICVKK